MVRLTPRPIAQCQSGDKVVTDYDTALDALDLHSDHQCATEMAAARRIRTTR